MSKDDDDAFTAKDRARWFISRAHLYHYTQYTELIDEPRLAHNDETHDVTTGTDSGHQGVDSPD